MSRHYYEAQDLKNFPNIGEFAPEQGKKFFEKIEKGLKSFFAFKGRACDI